VGSGSLAPTPLFPSVSSLCIRESLGVTQGHLPLALVASVNLLSGWMDANSMNSKRFQYHTSMVNPDKTCVGTCQQTNCPSMLTSSPTHSSQRSQFRGAPSASLPLAIHLGPIIRLGACAWIRSARGPAAWRTTAAVHSPQRHTDGPGPVTPAG